MPFPTSSEAASDGCPSGLLVELARYLFYDSAVDTRTTYIDGATGEEKPKKGSLYWHIGVAVAAR